MVLQDVPLNFFPESLHPIAAELGAEARQRKFHLAARTLRFCPEFCPILQHIRWCHTISPGNTIHLIMGREKRKRSAETIAVPNWENLWRLKDFPRVLGHPSQASGGSEKLVTSKNTIRVMT